MFARISGLIFLFLLVVLSNPARAAEQAGTMRFNSGTKMMEFYDGHAWYNFGIGLALGACGTAGMMDFDNLLSNYKFCNGTSWIRIIGIPTLAVCSKKGEMDFNGSTFLVCNGLLWTNIKGTWASS
jgi:hypothetical protein